MSSRLWVLAGLLSGVITGLAVLTLAVILGPEPGIAKATSSPVAGSTASPAPTLTPAGSLGVSVSTAAPTELPSIAPAGATSPLRIGQPAPALAVPQVGGGTIDLATLRGRPVWVVFLTASCSACVGELSLMNTYLSRYQSTNLVVLAVDVRDDEGTVANFAKLASATFPFGLDLEGTAQGTWTPPSLPAHYWIDRDGLIRDGATGIIGTERMAAGLRTVLPSVDVRP
jgi:peroxiredoxin